MTNNQERNERVIDFYGNAVVTDNLINSMQAYLENDYLKNSWGVGLINISRDIKRILGIIESCDFSFDYKIPNTFNSYLRLFDYMIDKMMDDSLDYEEGINTVHMVFRGLRMTANPYLAFICSRVRDLGLLESIGSAKSLYNKMEEEGIDELKKVDMSSIFDFAFESSEDLYDDYNVELFESIKEMFGENYELEDFSKIAEIISAQAMKNYDETSIIKDF